MLLFLVTKWSSPVADMMLHGDHGAAWRRRQRRQRSRRRHEQLSVAMALSAAVHHSFDEVAAEVKYSGLPAQKTDRAEAAHNAPRRPTTRADRGPELFQSAFYGQASTAEGGTFCGSAHRVVSLLAPATECRADFRQSSSAWSWEFRR